MKLAGGCRCGALRYQVDGDLGPVANCHCAFCRRVHGAPFTTIVFLSRDAFAWAPGSAEARLPVIAAILAAADDPELVARAHLLRATALLELGDPAGLDDLLTYVAQAEALGHGRGRWGALIRRATYAQIAGQVDEAVRLGEQALELGLAIGEPDTIGCFCTHRWSLVALERMLTVI